MTQKEIVFSTDLGGGIIDTLFADCKETFLGPSYLQTPEVPEVFAALRQIVTATRGKKGECNVYVISACETALRKKAEWWLNHRQFCEQTGIPPENILFCDSRREKAAVCKRLGVNYHVDNRLEVLSTLPPDVVKILFRRDPDEAGPFPTMIPKLRRAERWSEVAGLVLKDD